MNKLLLFLLCFVFVAQAQFDDWLKWERLSKLDKYIYDTRCCCSYYSDCYTCSKRCDSLDVTNNFNGATDIDSIFVRKSSTTFPASKTRRFNIFWNRHYGS